MKPALGGIRVFDASAGIAGPHAGHLLARAGAEVIKLEPPDGEWGRMIGRKLGSVGVSFLAYNGAKRSLAIDLKDPEGVKLARQVALQCDVVIESFRPGVMDRLGLGYESLRTENPALIYASVSGFGGRGPKAGRPALDTVIQAQSGWLDMSRDKLGNPCLMDFVPVDVLTGLYASQAILIALMARFRFGEGARIEISLLEAAAAFLAPKLMEAASLPAEGTSAAGVPTGIYPTADGLVALATKDDRQFAKLANALGHPEWATDARFATRAARHQNKEACEALVTSGLRQATASHWDDRLAEDGIVAAKVNKLAEFLEDRHFQELGQIAWNTQADGVRFPSLAVPGNTALPHGQVPGIGEHSVEILQQFGISRDRIDAGVAQGFVRTLEKLT